MSLQLSTGNVRDECRTDAMMNAIEMHEYDISIQQGEDVFAIYTEKNNINCY